MHGSLRHLIILLFLAANLQAQDFFSIESGPKTFIENGSLSPVFDYTGEDFYFVRLSDKGVVDLNNGPQSGIEVFSQSLNPEQSIKLSLNSDETFKRLTPVRVFKTTKGFILMCQHYSRAEETIRAFLFRTDEVGNIIGKVEVPAEVGGVLPANEDFHYFQFNRFQAGEESRYIFTLTTPPELEVPERVNMIVFDENLEKISEHLISFPEDYIDYDFSRHIVSPQGQIFFRLEIFNPFMPGQNIHQLIIYDIVSDLQRTYEFNLGEGHVESLKFEAMQNNRVGLTGFFTSDKESETPDGILYYVFSGEDGTLLRQKIHKFTGDVRSAFNPKSFRSTSEPEHLIPAAIHLNNQGHILLLFEYNWRSILLVRDQQQQIYPTPMYNANEVIILTFDASDEFVNIGVVHKQQSQGIRPGITGFFSYVYGEHLFLFYNDHPKNINRYKSGDIKIMKGRYEPVAAIYNTTSATYQKQKLDRGRGELSFNPADIFITEPNSLLILNSDNGYWLSRITFPE